jgi:hypothetical protein
VRVEIGTASAIAAVNGTAASRNVSSKNSRLGIGLAYLTASAA